MRKLQYFLAFLSVVFITALTSNAPAYAVDTNDPVIKKVRGLMISRCEADDRASNLCRCQVDEALNSATPQDLGQIKSVYLAGGDSVSSPHFDEISEKSYQVCLARLAPKVPPLSGKIEGISPKAQQEMSAQCKEVGEQKNLCECTYAEAVSKLTPSKKKMLSHWFEGNDDPGVADDFRALVSASFMTCLERAK